MHARTPLALAVLMAFSACTGDSEMSPTEPQASDAETPTQVGATPTQALDTPTPIPDTPTPIPDTPTPTETPTDPPAPTAATGPFDFAIQLSGMGGGNTGQSCWVRIWDGGTGDEVGRIGEEQIVFPDFTLELDQILEPGINYTVDIWVDRNGNGVYDAPSSNPVEQQGRDQSWRTYTGVVVTDTSVSYAANNSFVDVAWPD